MLQEIKKMFNIRWEGHTAPEYDPDRHNPDRAFALLCYRGIHYAKWVQLNIVFYKYNRKVTLQQ